MDENHSCRKAVCARFRRSFRDVARYFAVLLMQLIKASLRLETHRIRFKSYPHTFTSEEALVNLGSLKFRQSNRMADPAQPGRVVTTTTTTTFTMARIMAKEVCQKFIDARFIECANDNEVVTFKEKSFWQPTPKGIHVLGRFAQRSGISNPNVQSLLSSGSSATRILTIERDGLTDQIPLNTRMVETIFRNVVGRFNLKRAGVVNETDVAGNLDPSLGVKLELRQNTDIDNAEYYMHGQSIFLWLLNYSSVLDAGEAEDILDAFLKNRLIARDTSQSQSDVSDANNMSWKKNHYYIITPKGVEVAGLKENLKRDSGVITDSVTLDGTIGLKGCLEANRETNAQKLHQLLGDPSLRSVFRDFLRQNFCEENLSFWLDCDMFLRRLREVRRDSIEEMRESLASAFNLYNTYLAPGSPNELNLDHNLRNEIAAHMTRFIGDDCSTIATTFEECSATLSLAQAQVFKLMAGVRI